MSKETTAPACADSALIAFATSATAIVYTRTGALDQMVRLLPAGHHYKQSIAAYERFVLPANAEGIFVPHHRGSPAITINLGDHQ